MRVHGIRFGWLISRSLLKKIFITNSQLAEPRWTSFKNAQSQVFNAFYKISQVARFSLDYSFSFPVVIRILFIWYTLLTHLIYCLAQRNSQNHEFLKNFVFIHALIVMLYCLILIKIRLSSTYRPKIQVKK